MRPDETNMNASRENVAEAVPAPVSPEDEKLERGPFVDGFSIRTVIGALFVALVMMPGAIYMGLVAGQSLLPGSGCRRYKAA